MKEKHCSLQVTGQAWQEQGCTIPRLVMLTPKPGENIHNLTWYQNFFYRIFSLKNIKLFEILPIISKKYIQGEYPLYFSVLFHPPLFLSLSWLPYFFLHVFGPRKRICPPCWEIFCEHYWYWYSKCTYSVSIVGL